MRKPKHRLRIAHLHLGRWGYFEMNFNTLTDYEKESCKLLFYALKRIPSEDRALLAEKYRIERDRANRLYNNNFVPDTVLAKARGMRLIDYRKKRKAIECEFNLHLLEGIKQVRGFDSDLVEDLYQYELYDREVRKENERLAGSTP
ncbi:hypothetical protein J2R98_002322 [Alkalibacillus filiformis]|uniref:Uncharacterized protein n=1 Tax=Alkalibacillus filiformis TaxID=200990 RepID=A0ABU0DVI3_9BACI|nr:hypothetical protein [Alkalibacillus filiformis]MDQ0352478.1 hypothetical protein [Alkalibacillus filiformis]